MGKYMKKGKITGDLAVMEVPQSALGVRTRARTLALQQSPDLCYLQLRSRRLEKPQFPPPSPPKPERQDKQKLCNRGVHVLQPVHSQSERAGSRLRVASVNSVPAGSPSFSRSKKLEVGDEEADAEECAAKLGSRSATPLERAKGGAIGTDLDDFGVEASFGENNLEFDGTGRVTRESTPCSLIRDLDSIGTPVSAVRSTCSGAAHQRRPRNSMLRSIPSTQEMDDFFANAEMQQQNQFMEKYNFDVVNNLPLPGRYEWVRVDP